jgi:hypothetical protein
MDLQTGLSADQTLLLTDLFAASVYRNRGHAD